MALTLPLTGNIVGDEATQGGIIYRWNGVAWVALHLVKVAGLGSLTDVDLSAAATDNYIQYDGTNWVAVSIPEGTDDLATAGTDTIQRTWPATAFAAIGGGGSGGFVLSSEIISASAVWSPAADGTYIILAVGGGGSGAAVGYNDSGHWADTLNSIASGGGGGGTAIALSKALTTSDVLTISVGAGGVAAFTGSSGTFQAGNNGGDTTVTGAGLTLFGGGGGGGDGSRTAGVNAIGAAGGTASGGDQNVVGGTTATITQGSGGLGTGGMPLGYNNTSTTGGVQRAPANDFTDYNFFAATSQGSVYGGGSPAARGKNGTTGTAGGNGGVLILRVI